MVDEAPSTTHDEGGASEALAREIKRRRQAAGLSQPQLAQRIGYTRQYVSLAERVGQNLPSPSLVKALDRALEAQGALIALRNQAKNEQHDKRRHISDTPFANEPLNPSTIFSQGVGQGDAEPGSLSRKTLLHESRGRIDLEEPGRSTEAYIESVDLNRRLESSDIGLGTLDQLSLAIENLGINYLHIPTSQTLKEASLIRRYATGLLDGKLTLSQRKHLYAIAGWLSALIGHMAFDTGDSSTIIDGHLGTALHIANEVHDGDLVAWTRGTQALSAIFRNRPQIAVDAAQAGRPSAPQGSIMTVRLLAQEARAHARLGDQTTSEKCLARAERAFDHVSDPLTASIFSFDRPYLPFYAGTCYTWLELPNKAEKCSREAIMLCDSVAGDWPVARVLARVDLANALMEQNELEEARELTHECFNICLHGRRTDTMKKQLHGLVESLDSRASSSYAGELIEQFNMVFKGEGTLR